MIKIDPRFDRKRQLAQALIGRGFVQPPQQGNMHWSQGLAGVLSTLAGGLANKKVDEAEKQYRQDAHKTISDALNPDPVQVGEAHGPTQTPKTSRYGHLVSTLAGNPATADTALNLQLQNELAKVKSNKDAPSSVREWEYYSNLDPDGQKKYLEMKRSFPWLNTKTNFIPTGPGGTVDPGNAVPIDNEGAARAVEEGKTAAQKDAAEETAAKKIPTIETIWDNLKDKDFDRIYGRGESLYPDVLRSQEGIDMQADVTQLINLLKLGARGELKGQGTVSDFEAKMIGDAVTVLQNQNISPEKAKEAAKQAVGILFQGAGSELPETKYSVGQVIEVNGKRYRVTGGDLSGDPDVELVQ